MDVLWGAMDAPIGISMSTMDSPSPGVRWDWDKSLWDKAETADGLLCDRLLGRADMLEMPETLMLVLNN
jgi:hypothetical protein